jgi:hypothetical protein
MALPELHPLSEVVVYAHTADMSTAGSAFARAPFRGKVVKVGSVIHAAVTTADNGIITKINSTAITGGTYTHAASGSAAGEVRSATPTAANTVNEDDNIEFASDGAGSGTVPATYFAVVRRT